MNLNGNFIEELIYESSIIVSKYYNDYYWSELYNRFVYDIFDRVNIVVNPGSEYFGGYYDSINYGGILHPEIINKSIIFKTPLMNIDTLVYRNNSEEIIKNEINKVLMLHNKYHNNQPNNGDTLFSIEISIGLWLRLIEAYIGVFKTYPNNRLILFLDALANTYIGNCVRKCIIHNFGYTNDIRYTRDPYEVIAALDNWFIFPVIKCGTFANDDNTSLHDMIDYLIGEDSIFYNFGQGD